MVLGDIVSVIVGVIFVWMLLGVAVMQVQEWLVGWLSLRADSLEDAVRGMLLAPKPRLGPWGRFWEQVQRRPWFHAGPLERLRELMKKLGFRHVAGTMLDRPKLVERFYRHPLIRSLEQERVKPSYFPADTFALVLLDVVMVAGLGAPAVERALENLKTREDISKRLRQQCDELLKTKADSAGAGTPEWLARVGEILEPDEEGAVKIGSNPESGMEYLRELIDSELRAQLPQDAGAVMDLVNRGADKLLAESPLLQQRLEILLRQAIIKTDNANERLLLLRQQAETWFDDTMDHVTGWYKRNRQWGAFAIGLMMAAILNIDSIQITTGLWQQPALRETLAAAASQDFEAQAAESGAVEPSVVIEQLEESLSALRVPIGWNFVPVAVYDPARQSCRLFPDDSEQEVGGLAWNRQCLRWQDAPKGWGVLTKLVGLVITAAAAMQGAPFWFDVLDKVLPIRAAGIRPGERRTNGMVSEKRAPPTRPQIP